MQCHLRAKCFNRTSKKRTRQITAGGVLRNRLLCSHCKAIFCRQNCKDAHQCDPSEVLLSDRYDEDRLREINEQEKQRWQLHKEAKRARIEPKLSFGPGDDDVMALGVALLSFLDRGRSYDAALAMLTRIEAAPDAVEAKAAAASAYCKSCRVKLDLLCYKDPSDDALTGDLHCGQCSGGGDAKQLMRLADDAQVAKLQLFLEEFRRVVPHPGSVACASMGQEAPTIVPGFCLVRDGSGTCSSGFTASQLASELECFETAELLNALEKAGDEDVVNELEDATPGECAKRVLKVVNAGKYVSCNAVVRSGLSSCLAALNARLRRGECRTGARGVTDAATSTLVLIGDASAGTRFHVDWSEAKNVAFSLQLSGRSMGQQEPLALWVFVHPGAAAAASSWLSSHVPYFPQGFQTADPPRLKMKDVYALQQALGLSTDGTWLVRLLYQHAGDMVLVPAGWVHTVINVRPCVKLAFDIYRPSHFAAYLQSWREVASVVTATSNACDYMAVATVMLQAVLSFVDAQLLARASA